MHDPPSPPATSRFPLHRFLLLLPHLVLRPSPTTVYTTKSGRFVARPISARRARNRIRKYRVLFHAGSRPQGNEGMLTNFGRQAIHQTCEAVLRLLLLQAVQASRLAALRL